MIRERLGIDAVALRYLARGTDDADGPPVPWVPWVLEFEAQAQAEPTAGGRWIWREELERLTVSPPDHRPLLEAWFAEDAGSIPPLRTEWARPGWFARASHWIDERIERIGGSRTGPIEQVKLWSISCVLRASTTAGTVYFKAVPPFFGHEPQVTQALAALYPEQIPEVIDIDAGCGWMLMHEMHGSRLGTLKETERWEEALRAYALLQIDSVAEIETLLEAGCLDRRLSALPGQIDLLWSEIRTPEARDLYAVTEAEAEALAGLAGPLKAQSAELAAFSLPETLIHGDLHAGNVMMNDRPIFFDWTDCAIAHPFFDMLTFGRESEEPAVSEEGDDARRLRNAYLEPWLRYASMDRLNAALDLALRVALVYHAWSYRTIALNAEPAVRGELSDSVGFYLRQLPLVSEG